MKALVFVLLTLLPGCPKGVPPAEIAREKLCYTVSIGFSVVTDGAPCPLYESIDDIAWQVAEHYNLVGDPRWTWLTVYLTERFVIDCGFFDEFGVWKHGKDTMGCTYMHLGEAYVSMWALWNWHDVLRHELSHFAIYLGDNSELDHMRLDGKFP